MKYSIFEILIGFIVIFVSLGALIFFSSTGNELKNSKNYYLLEAEFKNIEGITLKSEVKLSGITIGYVKDIKFTNDYYVLLKLSIKNEIKIPIDSKAVIKSAGLFDHKFISVKIGSDKKYLSANDKIVLTESALNLEEIINRFFYVFSMK